MWTEILNLAISNGIWAVLFLGLLIYQLRDSHRRESKYQNTISHLNTSLGIVKSIKEDVVEIKEDVEDIKIDLKELRPTRRGADVSKIKCLTKEAKNEATNY